MSIAKPRHHQLFQSKIFKDKQANFEKLYNDPAISLARHPIVLKWIESLQSGTLDGVKEVSLHGEFLNDLFRDVLGYK